MIKLFRLPIVFAFTMSLVGILISSPALVRTETASVKASAVPPAPDTGTPGGNPTPGTTRPEATCPKTNKPLTALVANKGSDYTSSEYPTFWFYVPYAPSQISNMEFLLLDSKESTTIYRTAIKLTEKPGIIKVTVPSKPQYSLKFNENYRWYFMLDCKPARTDEPALVVDGWVRRQPMNQQANQIKQEYIADRENILWYDAITALAEKYAANPENRQFEAAWTELLKSLGYTWVIQEPFVGSELLLPAD